MYINWIKWRKAPKWHNLWLQKYGVQKFFIINTAGVYEMRQKFSFSLSFSATNVPGLVLPWRAPPVPLSGRVPD
jgi:hypothetical protein